MKTAIAAIQGMATHELTELADTVWCAQKTQHKRVAKLWTTQNWQLAEAAEQLRQQHAQVLQDENAKGSDGGPSPVTARRRRGNWVKRLWEWLKSSLGGTNRSCSGVQPTASHGSDLAANAEQESHSQQASPVRAHHAPNAQSEEIKQRPLRINLKNLNPLARKFVGQTIIGRVTLEMVLAELERRGHPYTPPLGEDGTIIIRECDLTNETLDSFRKVRPGIDKLLREGGYQGIKICANSPVRIDHPLAFENLKFESSSAVSLPALKAGAVVSPHVRVDGSVEAKIMKTKKLDCKDLKAEVVEAVNLSVERDANVKQLAVDENLTIGSTLDGTQSIHVRGNARIGRLGGNIPASCKVEGKYIAEVFREIAGQTKPTEDFGLRPGVAGSADHRIEEAFAVLKSDGRTISASRLARLSSTNYTTANRWLKEHHPELTKHRTESVNATTTAQKQFSDKVGTCDELERVPEEPISPGVNGQRLSRAGL